MYLLDSFYYEIVSRLTRNTLPNKKEVFSTALEITSILAFLYKSLYISIIHCLYGS